MPEGVSGQTGEPVGTGWFLDEATSLPEELARNVRTTALLADIVAHLPGEMCAEAQQLIGDADLRLISALLRLRQPRTT